MNATPILIASALGGVFVLFALYFAFTGLRNGRLWAGYIAGYIERSERPVSYWVLLAAYVLGAAGVALFIAYVFAIGPAPGA